MKCIICEKEITTTTNPRAKYCSQVCNNIAFRNRNRERHNEIRRNSYANHKDTQHASNRRNYLAHHQHRLMEAQNYRLDNHEKVIESNRIWRNNNKEYLKETKQQHRQDFNDLWKSNLFCDICGAKYPEKELHFHHWDKTTKKFEISHAEFMNFLEIIAELSKCIVLCNSCHSRVHANERWGNPIFA